MHSQSIRQPYQYDLLDRHLRAFLGDIDASVMATLRGHLQWVEIAGGETLITQGEPGDSMYLSISGRLRAFVRSDDGSQRPVRDMGRGEIIGEMSLYTGEPRMATVVAIRDSVLVRLDKTAFNELLASSAQVSIAFTRQIIKRLQGDQARTEMERPVTIGLFPVTAKVDLREFGERLAAQMGTKGRVRLVDPGMIDESLREAGVARRDAGNADANRRIALLLDEIEATHDVVILLADDAPSGWTRRCSRHCDELLLLADASAPPALHPIETEILMHRHPRAQAAELLVLLHPAERQSSRDTRMWLDRRPVADHIHIRSTLDRDMARLARMQSRTAVGLVLAGGGARGFAHLGIYRALQERGIEIDYVGGTSIGSVMAAYVASDQPLAAVIANARKWFSLNPTGDFNLLPLLSLIKGRRLRGVLANGLKDLVGFDPDAEDLWKNFFCVSTNYSKASEHLFRRGNLAKCMLSSLAIPGALPPVIHDGDLLCDGGTFNNFPVDVMQRMRGVGRVIGVDLDYRKPRRIELDELPGNWALLRDRFRRRNRRRYRLPSLSAYLMNVTILYSTSRRGRAQQLTDLYFNPPMDRVGMLEWKKFDQIVGQGHDHGVEVLGKLSESELGRFSAALAQLCGPQLR
jgi:NTE family protein